MKPLAYPCSFALTLLLGSLGLSGCGGALNFPDAAVSSQVQGPPVQGSVYGGHAPIVGAHVYVLQPGTSGYGSAATSLLGSVIVPGTPGPPATPPTTVTVTSASGYAITANPAVGGDPNVPVGAEYETTDSSGGFNLTGGYSCTAGQPVYLYSYGTSASTVTGKAIPYAISQIVVSGRTTGSSGTATYTFTVSPAGSFSANQSVTISGLTGNFTIINAAQTVSTGGTTTFAIKATDYYGPFSNDNIANGTYTSTTFGGDGEVTGTATEPATNPQVELATLGICPSSGNFSTAGNGALSFVYMNEVSTVATAYTFQPFTVASNNNAWDIGSSGTTQALVGIANAAYTAAQLYDIQGAAQLSNTGDGEGHIANFQTLLNGTPNKGNGTVPQATIDTLANILAACIDSTPATGGLLSSQCTTLFNTATDNGQTLESGDTTPTDTATAAINIARYPAGNNSGGSSNVDATYASDLLGIPTGTVPYAPNLGTNAPNDWTISISYTGGGLGATNGKSPHSVAIDASGNVYTVNYSSPYSLSIFSPLGVDLSTGSGYSGNGLNKPDSVAIDSTASNVWIANYGSTSVSEFTTSGSAVNTYSISESDQRDAEIDGSGNIWVTTDSTTNYLKKLNSSGTVVTGGGSSDLYTPASLAIEPTTDDVWVADNTESSSHYYATMYSGTIATRSDLGGIDAPVGSAIDAHGYIWFANNNGTVTALKSATTIVTGSPFTIGDTNDGIAIDGADNVWVTNSAGGVCELTNAGAAISPTAGYTATDPDGIAIDPSGNVWYGSTNTTGTLYELVGAATPVVTPISYAVAHSKLGTQP